MAQNTFNPINILDTSEATGLGSGGSLTIGGGASIGKDFYVGGNLSISGTTTNFADNILLVNKNPSSSVDTGILFQRYTNDITNNQNFSGIIYSEQSDEFQFGYVLNEIERSNATINSFIKIKTNGINSISNINTIGNIVTNGDNLGIGTVSPNDRLHLYTASTNTNIGSIIQNGSRQYRIGIRGDTNNSFAIQDDTAGEFRIVINTSGNVGIGTNSPLYTLDVNGTANISTSLTTGSVNSLNITSTNIVATNVSTGTFFSSTGTITNSNITSGTIGTLLSSNVTITNANVTTQSVGALLSNTGRFKSDVNVDGNLQVGNTNGGYLINLGTSGVAGYRSGYLFGDGTNMIILNQQAGFVGIASNNGSNQFRVVSSGNVGIGVESPTYRLDVAGNLRVTSGDITLGSLLVSTANVTTQTTGTSIITGNIGIGTISPSDRLHLYTASTNGNIGTIIQNGSQQYRMGIRGDTNNSFVIQDDTANAFRMVINTSGNVGIGTTNPLYPLHVNGFVNGDIGTYTDYLTGISSGSVPISIYASSRVVATQFNAYSDSRIKTNISDIDKQSALSTIRLLKPKIYNYIDTILRGTKAINGFIAQEVSEIIESATSIITDFIPNIYDDCIISTLKGDCLITLVSEKPIFDTSSNSTGRVKIYTCKNEEMIVTIKDIISDNSFTINEHLEDLSYIYYFVYGQEVKNFHILDKNNIYTITTAAVQEIDNQLQQTKTELDETKKDLDETKKELIQTKRDIEENKDIIAKLIQRIYDLENKYYFIY